MNLAPADLRKEGSGFDLPIALAVLGASHQVASERLATHAAVGELALDGRIRPVGGVLAAAEGARRAGLERMLCAAESAAEAALAGIEPVPVEHLAEAAAYLRGEAEPAPYEPCAIGGTASPAQPDLADVRGQERARRALELAAAGGHNLLLAGPPGTGKTMLARRLPGLLPPLGPDEALEVTRIHSVAGLLWRPSGRSCATRRSGRRITAPRWRRSSGAAARPGPARSAWLTGACCCSTSCRNSCARLSRRFASPSRTGWSAWRGQRAGRSIRPGSSSSATMNLCPCGARGDPGGECSCSPQRLASFRDKLSRALLDRFDLVVTVPRPRAGELAAGPSEASAVVAERIDAAA